jgi:uncharacterized phage infection (PIP) family protein YhgE
MDLHLPTEQFNTMKELAEVQSSIAASSAALSKLKEDTGKYLELREVAAHERVQKVLAESIEALESTNKNHAELASYASGLRALALELSGFSVEIVTLYKDFTERVVQTDALLDLRLEEAKKLEKACRIERKKLDEDMKQLDNNMAELRDQKRLLADRQQMLAKGAEELQKLRSKANV